MAFYRRNLPHIQEPGAEYFITFRLDGSIPRDVVRQMREEKEELKKLKKLTTNEKRYRYEALRFKKYENLLDGQSVGPTWLKEKKIASIVIESIHFRDGVKYDLYAFCIMSNHVHMVFKDLSPKVINTNDTEEKFPVTETLKDLKSYTGLQANRALNRTGSFWHEESYDHMIRNNTSLEKIILYTINNPVKAKLINDWRGWPYTYCKSEFTEGL